MEGRLEGIPPGASPSGPGAPPEKVPLRAVAWCYAGNVGFSAGLFFHAFLYNFYLDGLGLKAGVMGQAASLLTAGGLLAVLPAGWLVDRVGSRAALRAAIGIAVLGLAGGAFAESAASIGLTALVTGAATSTWRVASLPALMSLADHSLGRARLFGWNVALLVGSGGLWYALAGTLPRWLEPMVTSRHASIRWTLLAGSLLTGLALICYAAARIPSPVRRPASERLRASQIGCLGPLAIPRPAIAIAVAAAAWMIGSAMLSPFYNIYFHDRFGLAIDRLGLIFGLSHLATAAVVLASGEVATRVGPIRTLAGWITAFPALTMLLAFVSVPGPALAVYFLLGLVSPSSNPLFDQLLFDRVPVDRRGLAASWRNGATETSGALGAWLGGLVLEASSYRVLFAMATLSGVVGGAAVASTALLPARREPEPPAEQPPGTLSQDRG